MVLLAATAVTWYIASEVGSLPGQEPRYWEPHLKAEHMAAPTHAANVKKALANTEPSTHGTKCRAGGAYVRPKLGSNGLNADMPPRPILVHSLMADSDGIGRQPVGCKVARYPLTVSYNLIFFNAAPAR